jgi:hypothetical protein
MKEASVLQRVLLLESLDYMFRAKIVNEKTEQDETQQPLSADLFT